LKSQALCALRQRQRVVIAKVRIKRRLRALLELPKRSDRTPTE
jgi:hypothetical protein